MLSNAIPLSAMTEYYTPKLTAYLQNLGRVAQTMNIVEMVTPVNAGVEKQKWLEKAARGRLTNPSFQYNRSLLAGIAKRQALIGQLLEGFHEMRKSLSREDPGEALRSMTLYRFLMVQTTINVANSMLKGDDDATGCEVKTIFEYPTEETVDEARDFLEELLAGSGYTQEDTSELKRIRRRLKKMEFNAEQIRENFIWMAEQCGIAGTRPVEISEITTAIDVRDTSSRGAVVSIPADRKVSGLKVIELAGHEVLCHWCDSERAKTALPLLGGGALKPADETLYEGHAVLTDYYTKLMLGRKAPWQAQPFYVLAIAMAAKGNSFAECARRMFDLIRPLKQSDEAALKQTWTVCYRVFRGSRGDQDNCDYKYAFAKDQAYFVGRKLAESLALTGQDELLRLGTLTTYDIKCLSEVIDFSEETINDHQQNKLLLTKLVRRLLDEEVVF